MHNYYMQVALIITLNHMWLINITQYLNVELHCNKDTWK